MNPLVSEFIEKVLVPVKYKKMHAPIAKELEDHLELLKEDYIEDGVGEKVAYQKAVEDMGDAAVIGHSLHNIHKPKMEWSIVILIAVLVSISFVMLAIWNNHYSDSPYAFDAHIRQSIYIVLGITLIGGVYFLDYKYFERYAVIGWCIGNLILLGVLLYGISINGARRWINIGFITFSAVQLARPFLILSYAGLIRKWGNGSIRDRIGLGVTALLPMGLIAVGNIFEAVVLGSVFLVMLTCYISSKEFEGNKIKWLSILYGMASSGVALFSARVLSGNTHRIQRLTAFIHPELDPMGDGYQYIMMEKFRESASWIGDNGLKVMDGYMPVRDMPSDMIFIFIVGKLGWLAGGVLVAILAFVILRLFVAGTKVQEAYGRLAVLSIAALFTVQFVVNILMNLGYMPLTTVYLPFVSYGGSAMIGDMLMIGIFLSIYRRKDITVIQPNLPKIKVKNKDAKVLDIARKLILLEIDTEVITEATGLTPEEIQNL